MLHEVNLLSNQGQVMPYEGQDMREPTSFRVGSTISCPTPYV